MRLTERSLSSDGEEGVNWQCDGKANSNLTVDVKSKKDLRFHPRSETLETTTPHGGSAMGLSRETI